MIDPSHHPRPTTANQRAERMTPPNGWFSLLPTRMSTGDHPLIAEVRP